MGLFKKIKDNLYSILDDDPKPSQAAAAPKAAPVNMPDYSAYVFMKPEDDIYCVSHGKLLDALFPEIASEYDKAVQSYKTINKSHSEECDYRKTYVRLNKVFFMIVEEYLKGSKIPYPEGDLTAAAELLPKVGFTSKEMNIVHGAVHMINVYEKDPSLAVTDYDIKVHFISVGLIFRIFKKTVSEAAKKQDLKPKGKNDLSICTPEAIKKSYDKAKSLNRKNNPKDAVEALENTAELAVGRIGALNRIVIYHKCEMLKLLAALTQLNLVSKPFAAAAYDVLTYAAKCKKGAQAQQAELQSLIQKAGSTFVHEACAAEHGGFAGKERTYPSFKEIEKKSAAYNFPLGKEFPELHRIASEAIDNASDKKRTSLIKFGEAFEFMVNTLCQRYEIRFDTQTDVFGRIDKLREGEVISAPQRNLMRKMGSVENVIAQSDSEDIPEEVFNRYTGLFREAVEEFLSIIISEDAFNNIPLNTPMFDPDFYSSDRKYYGLWADAARKEQLLLNTEYVQLKRAADSGDINAMLSIAIGFLQQPGKLQWGFDRIVALPNFEKQGYKVYPDPYDARYYFWLIEACKKAYSDWIDGKRIPLKYIATALAESIKYMCGHALAASGKQNAERTMPNQDDLGFNLFGKKMSYDYETISGFAAMLICMLKEYGCSEKGTKSIIAPLHAMTPLEIKARVYVYNYCCIPKRIVSLEPMLMIKPEHVEKSYEEVMESEQEFFTRIIAADYLPPAEQ